MFSILLNTGLPFGRPARNLPSAPGMGTGRVSTHEKAFPPEGKGCRPFTRYLSFFAGWCQPGRAAGEQERKGGIRRGNGAKSSAGASGRWFAAGWIRQFVAIAANGKDDAGIGRIFPQFVSEMTDEYVYNLRFPETV